MGRQEGDRSSERGAVLIVIAMTILVLAAFLTFVVDHGVMWVARGQAQNAADAGALAGAVARGFDDNADLTSSGKAYRSALQVANANTIINSAGAAEVDWTCPADLGLPANSCVRVDVMRGAPDRNGAMSGTALPTFFAPLLNIATQGVRATATAIATNANTTQCLKPWFIPDKWGPTWPDPDGTFDPADGDYYQAPSSSGTGTGYSTADIGRPWATDVELKGGNGGAYEPSDYFEIGSAHDYQETITGCEITAKIGDTMDALPGNRVGPTNHGVDDLLNANNGEALVVVAMFSPQEYEDLGRPHGSSWQLHIVNMMGFRITHRQGNRIVGDIVGAPGELMGGSSSIGGNSALVKHVQLVR